MVRRCTSFAAAGLLKLETARGEENEDAEAVGEVVLARERAVMERMDCILGEQSKQAREALCSDVHAGPFAVSRQRG